jgi:hypothetical protein
VPGDMSEEEKIMPEFANRAEYEKWKAEVLDHLRREEGESRKKWVCPACLSLLPLSQPRCQCGYIAEQSSLRYLRRDVTPSELYETVRNEFHAGQEETALFLSRYLVKRFPEAEEARQLREYRERAHRIVAPGQGVFLTRDGISGAKAGASVSRNTKTFITAVSVVVLCLALAVFFLWRTPAETPVQKPEQVRNLTSLTLEPGGNGRSVAERMLQEKKHAEEREATRVQSPRAKLGYQKGRQIAGIFLTNKPSEVREKCYQAMITTGVRDTEYLVWCITGYYSYGPTRRHQAEAGEQDTSARGE